MECEEESLILSVHLVQIFLLDCQKAQTSKNKIVVQLLSCIQLFETSWTAACQASLSFTISGTWMPLSWWYYLTISSSVARFSCWPWSFPASESFPVSWRLSSDDQSIGASASASVLPMNIQGWVSLGLTGLMSLLSKRLSRVFSSTTIQRHQFFEAQPSLWSNFHIHTWLWKNHSFD